MPGAVFLQTWMDYFDKTRTAFQNVVQPLITDLENPAAVINTDQLLTAMMRFGYSSTIGAWDAFGGLKGSDVPTVAIPSAGAATGSVLIAIDNFMPAQLSATALNSLTGGAPIAVGDVNVNFNTGQLTVTLVNGPWPTGSYLGAVLYNNRPVALIYTQRP